MGKITFYKDNKPYYDKENGLAYVEVIKDFLVTKAKEANCYGFIVGISGGIDSSLVYAIAKQLPLKVKGVVMSVNGMLQSDLEHIKKLEEKFDDKFEYIDLTDAFNALSKQVNVKNQLAVANIKPRLRMTTLYALAQENNSLVLGTDNKDETFIGYFTKYGDGGVDLLPICHLTKGEVRFLASLQNVPSEIIDKAPSAGLWENQTDEDELGFSYAQLDFYLDHLNDYEQIKSVLPEEVIKKIEYKHKISQHKRDSIYKPNDID
ncbi:NAD(+) synthase [Mycoplasma sp. 4079]|uniref:NAD(+) synthase n=1 Tax=Mycoplasma sp. 4079 TaxID=3398615 RepID=UPI0039FD25CB